MQLTPSQAAAVEHRGSSMLVSASAGSGKTEVLARRCVSLITDSRSPCDVTQLLVVTFTRAAAAELRVRIARLLRQAETAATNRKQRDHLRRQTALIGLADIGTIDSWCQRMVREHFVTAGVDPNFGVLSDADAVQMRQVVLDGVFADVFEDRLPIAAEVRAWLARAGQLDPEFLRELVVDLHSFRGQLVNPETWFTQQKAAIEMTPEAWRVAAFQLLAPALAQEMNRQFTALEGLRQRAVGDTPPIWLDYLEALQAGQTQLRDPGRLLHVIDALGEFKISVRGIKDAFIKQQTEELREKWLKKRLQERWSHQTVEGLLTQVELTQRRQMLLLALEEEYHQRLTQAKHDLRRYGFDDIQRYALDLLGAPAEHERRSPTSLARQIRSRYRYVLVDEYQDTSPAQVELMRLVTSDKPSNAFLVGDVKQSIYRFRRAEPRLFTQQAQAFDTAAADGRLQHLSDNFRSHGGVLRPLNELFAALFDPALGGTAFAEAEQLKPAREAQEPSNPTLDAQTRIYVHALEQARGATVTDDETEDDANASDELNRIEREAVIAASEIQTLLERDVQIPDRKSGQLRPLALGDIAILVRSAKMNAVQIASMLRDQGLAAVAVGRESIFDADIVQDVLQVLRLLVMRADDVGLAAYLRGSMVELDEPGLLAIRQFAPQGDFLAACEAFLAAGPNGLVRDRLTTAFERLDTWGELACERDLPALMQDIARVGAFEAFALAQTGGDARVAMLHSLFDYAASFGADEGGNLADFVAHVDAVLAGEIEGPSVSASVVDAVAVMTIHASKGLEFPVVFVLGTGSRFRLEGSKANLLCDAELGLGLRTYDDQLRQDVRTPPHHLLRTIVDERAIEEELRLLYVATTRARELLFIVGHTNVGRWETYRATWDGQRLPLLTRMSAATMLDWVLLSLASAGTAEHDARWRITTQDANRLVIPERQKRASGERESQAAAQWADEAVQVLRTASNATPAMLPAVVSVSVLKQIATEETDPLTPLVATTPRLEWPALGAVAGDDAAVTSGAAFGTAVHRFFEVVDFGALASADLLEPAIAQAVADGVISAAEAQVLPRESLLWLGGDALGRQLAQHTQAVQREVPFAFLLLGLEPAPLVRGVVDAVLNLPDGMTIIDYKTDRFSDDLASDARLVGYRQQIQAYGQALSAIRQRPVIRRVLVLLRPQICLEVEAGPPIDPASLAGADR